MMPRRSKWECGFMEMRVPLPWLQNCEVHERR